MLLELQRQIGNPPRFRASKASSILHKGERVGQVPNVVFVEGMVRQKDRYLFYYGGADKYVGVAEASVLE